MLELLSKRDDRGEFVAYRGAKLEQEALVYETKGTAARWIKDLRGCIGKALESLDVVEDPKDIILSGGPGYRFSEKLSVHFEPGAAITDITDTSNDSDVGDGNVRDDDVSSRRNWILDQLAKGERLKAVNIADHFSVSLKTAERDLGSLKAQSKIEFIGSTRTGYYHLVVDD